MTIQTWLVVYTIFYALESAVRAVNYFNEDNFLMLAASLVVVWGIVTTIVSYVELRNQVLQEMRSKRESDK